MSTHALEPDALHTVCGVPTNIVNKRPKCKLHTATHKLELVSCGACLRRLDRFPQLRNIIRNSARADGLEVPPVNIPPSAPKTKRRKPKPQEPMGPLFGLAGIAPEPEPPEKPLEQLEQLVDPPRLVLVQENGVGVFREESKANALRRRIREAREDTERRHQAALRASAERAEGKACRQ